MGAKELCARNVNKKQYVNLSSITTVTSGSEREAESNHARLHNNPQYGNGCEDTRDESNRHSIGELAPKIFFAYRLYRMHNSLV